MRFGPKNFQDWNEQDVREDILAPLLGHLGYAKDSPNNIIRGQSLSLKYAKNSLGTKKPNTDPELRGAADYICEVSFELGRKVRWVLEAKSPRIAIDPDELQQAYSYANHPEVCAVYFCVCNGREFHVHQTSSGTQSPPIVRILYSELDKQLDVLGNLLRPEAMRRDWKNKTVDPGRPLGPGLRSIVRITGGHIEYSASTLPMGGLDGFTVFITGGAIERDEAGHLVGFFRTRAPFGQIQRLISRLGLEEFEALSMEPVLSTDPSKPSRFYSTNQIILPKGERLFDFRSGKEFILHTNLTALVESFAVGHLHNQTFSGIFLARFDYLELNSKVEAKGEFEVSLA